VVGNLEAYLSVPFVTSGASDWIFVVLHTRNVTAHAGQLIVTDVAHRVCFLLCQIASANRMRGLRDLKDLSHGKGTGSLWTMSCHSDTNWGLALVRRADSARLSPASTALADTRAARRDQLSPARNADMSIAASNVPQFGTASFIFGHTGRPRLYCYFVVPRKHRYEFVIH
jgi:hypothetical protein